MKEFTKADIKILRRRIGITLKQLGVITGFSHLQNIEWGQRPISRVVMHTMKTLEFIYIKGLLEEYKKFMGVKEDQKSTKED